MRLVGDVQVIDCSKNVTLHNRESALSLYCANDEDFLLLRNPNIKAGIKYKLSPENVLQVFPGVICRRKLTIRFKEPPHLLIIRNHNLLIQSFGNLVKFLCKPIGSPPIIKTSGVQKQLEDFKNIPRNLKVLKLHHIEMNLLPESIAVLQQLIHLEVVNGNLYEIPQFVGTMPLLTTLILSRNRLGFVGNWNFLTTPQMKDNLRQLDLQNNEIQVVPDEIADLNALLVLHLDYNLLDSIPNGILDMRSLRVLSVSNNRMRIFPYNLFPLAAFSLDLSNNPFISHYFVTSNIPQNHEVPTLKELAGRAVVDYRVPHTNTLPKTLLEYLKQAQYCEICTGAYFEIFFPCRFIAFSRLYAEILPGREYLHSILDIRNVCSRRCMQPELKSCELLGHLTRHEYEYMVRHLC